jgi:hypothetical protein
MKKTNKIIIRSISIVLLLSFNAYIGSATHHTALTTNPEAQALEQEKISEGLHQLYRDLGSLVGERLRHKLLNQTSSFTLSGTYKHNKKDLQELMPYEAGDSYGESYHQAVRTFFVDDLQNIPAFSALCTTQCTATFDFDKMPRSATIIYGKKTVVDLIIDYVPHVWPFELILPLKERVPYHNYRIPIVRKSSAQKFMHNQPVNYLELLNRHDNRKLILLRAYTELSGTHSIFTIQSLMAVITRYVIIQPYGHIPAYTLNAHPLFPTKVQPEGIIVMPQNSINWQRLVTEYSIEAYKNSHKRKQYYISPAYFNAINGDIVAMTKPPQRYSSVDIFTKLKTLHLPFSFKHTWRNTMPGLVMIEEDMSPTENSCAETDQLQYTLEVEEQYGKDGLEQLCKKIKDFKQNAVQTKDQTV